MARAFAASPTVAFALAVTASILFSFPIHGQGPATSTVKVAFIGDSGDGAGFGQVLQLIARENVDLILHQGDFSYSQGPTSEWLGRIETHVRGIPYLGSAGNHDDWARYYSGFFTGQISAIRKSGARVSGNAESGNYSILYRGIKIVFVHDNQQPFPLNGRDISPSQYIDDEFSAGDQGWRICSWHRNQESMQIGGKSDQVGWNLYDACRKHGAIVATAHEHSYQRTRTLADMQAQTVDPSCKDNPLTPDIDVCVVPGKTFSFVSGLGGTSIRDQDRCLPSTFPYGCDGTWAKIYTSTQDADFGALFITFNPDGNPNKAHGYFKNVGGQVIDSFHVDRSHQ